MPRSGASRAFSAVKFLPLAALRSTVRVVNTPPSCITCIGGFPYWCTAENTTLCSLMIGIHVKNIAGHKLLQQIIRLQIAQFIERPPELLRLIDLADSQR